MALDTVSPRKILIINIFGIGDVLFTTPLVQNLKTYYPQASLGYVCNARTAGFLRQHQDIAKLFIYERDEFEAVRQASRGAYFKKIKQFIRDIEQERYDMAFDVSLNTFMNFVTWKSRIKQRIGYNYKKRSPFLTHGITLNGYERKHVAEYYLDLLSCVGHRAQAVPLSLTVGQDDESWAESFTRTIPEQRRIGIVPGGGASWGQEAHLKRWKVENYAKLADKLIEKFGAAIILMGDQKESPLCQQMAALMNNRSYSACGQTTITQFAALTKRCSAVVVNDGGPLHIAVAAGAQTVSIFGPVDDVVYGPYPLGKHIVVKKSLACRPCYRQFRKAQCDHLSCLNDISVDDVVEGVSKIL